MTDKLKFYFSFRSPYSWLALYRINLLHKELPVEMQMIPVFPAKDKRNVMLSDQNKVKYIVKDVNRMASAYGLGMKWPEPFDSDWFAVHISYIYAQGQGKGLPFCVALYSARFLQGKNIGDEQIMRDTAISCGLDADALIQAQSKREYKRNLLQGMAMAKEDAVFGVPYFIYKDSAYWGNDRLEWLIRDINDNAGQLVPDLLNDPFKRPC